MRKRGIDDQPNVGKGRMTHFTQLLAVAQFLTSKALATRQTPDEIIHELVSKEIAASA